MFVDADDWIEFDACEILYNRICEQDCEIVMFHAIRESKESVVMNYGFEDGHIYCLENPNEREFVYHSIMHVPKFNNVYYSWDKVYKKSFILRYNIKYPIGVARSEDKIFILKCAQKMKKFYCVSDKLYHYRINDESVCRHYSKNVDSDRVKTANVLEPIAREMNEEMVSVLQNPSYNRIIEDYERFIFGVITDVLFLKFYHKENPEYKNREKDAIDFLSREPFCSVIRNVPYSKLSNFSKIKKFCLKYRLVSIFCYISLKFREYRGK